MMIPKNLQDAIEAECGRKHPQKHAKATSELTHRYREQLIKERYIGTEDQRQAYLVARLPATFAAVSNVLMQLQDRFPDFDPNSLLDLGSGPGTASWASTEIFPNIKAISLYEQDQEMIGIGKRLAVNSDHIAFRNASWQCANLVQLQNLPSYDLCIFSYSIGELPVNSWAVLLETVWKATAKALVIIEPGTPKGFEKIRQLREIMIGMKAHLIAPCPHALACPMSQGDWCHFSQRLERSAAHRVAKEGTLGYEDEKFSYMIFSKEVCDSEIQGRIVRHPLKRSGHVNVIECDRDGTIHQQTISKKNSDLYKWARKCSWGDPFLKNICK